MKLRSLTNSFKEIEFLSLQKTQNLKKLIKRFSRPEISTEMKIGHLAADIQTPKILGSCFIKIVLDFFLFLVKVCVFFRRRKHEIRYKNRTKPFLCLHLTENVFSFLWGRGYRLLQIHLMLVFCSVCWMVWEVWINKKRTIRRHVPILWLKDSIRSSLLW